MANIIRRRGAVGLAGFLVAVVLSVVLWQVATSAEETAVAAPDATAALGEPASDVVIVADGRTVYPASFRARFEDLDRRIGDCLTANGAQRVAMAEGGFAYPDTSGRAYAACAALLGESRELGESAEYARLQREAGALTKAFRSCLGVADQSPGSLASARAMGKDPAACAAQVNATGRG